MPTPFDWTPIFGIEFRFSSASNPTAATSLNKAYSEIIGKDELSEFFVTCEDEEEEGPLEIAPDPQLHILNCIAKAIAINLVEPPPDEITKGHIANLLDKCVIKHVRNGGSTKRMRYKTDFDAAAKHVIRTNTDDEPTVIIEITITHWRFKKNWRPDLFMEAYTGDPPSDDEVVHDTSYTWWGDNEKMIQTSFSICKTPQEAPHSLIPLCKDNCTDILTKHWGHSVVYPLFKPIFHYCGNTGNLLQDDCIGS
eukprot:jgi/Psemu1/29538/gm1.29538_g